MTDSSRDRLLGAMEPSVRPHIIEYAKNIGAIETDVIILMARKAACLVDALQQTGMLAIGSEVTSDRALDMDPSRWLIGRSVTIVDDVLVSGSTLYRTKELVEKAGAQAVYCDVLSVDRDNNSRIVVPDNRFLELSRDDSVRLCTQIVDAISLVPRPYNVDWPLMDDLSVPFNQLRSVFNVVGWQTIDLSTATQARAGVVTLTFEASSDVGHKLDESLGWAISAIAPLIKVRLYAHCDPDAARIRIRALPIVSLQPLDVDDIDRLFYSLQAHYPEADQDFWLQFVSAQSRLRLLQYVCSARLGEIWRSQVQLTTNLIGTNALEYAQVRYAFPPHLATIVSSICSADRRYFSAGPERLKDIQLGPDLISPSPYVGNDADSIQARLSQPFLNFFRDREIRARKVLRERGVEALHDADFNSLLNRLHSGIDLGTMEQLARLDFDVDPASSRLFVSRFLDLAIDHGVVVPIVEQRGSVILRTFRHGEDVKFAKADIRLAGLLLQQLSRFFPSNAIPHTIAEKALVLLVRFGIARGWMNPYYGRLGDPDVASVRPDLYGSVVQMGSTEYFGHNKDNSLTHLLRVGGILTDYRGHYQVAGELPGAPTLQSHESEAQELGALLGELMTAQPGRGKLEEPELRLIATIPTTRDVPLALGAEVDIFVRRWGLQSMAGFRTALPSTDSRGRRQPRWLLFDRAVSNDITWQAIESGVEKYRSYRSRTPDAIVRRVAEELKPSSTGFSWESRWEALRGDESGGALDELRVIADRLGNWLIETMVELTVLRVSSAALAGSEPANRHAARLLRKLLDLIRLLPSDLESSMRQRLERLQAELIPNGIDGPARVEAWELKSADAVVALNRLRDRALGLIDAARACAGDYGRPPQVLIYSAAAVISVVPRGQATMRAANRRLDALIDQRKRAARGRDVIVEAVPRDLAEPHQTVVLFKGMGSVTQLATFVGQSLELCSAYDVNVVAVPDLRLALPVYASNRPGEFHAAALMTHLPALMGDSRPGKPRLNVVAPANSGLRTAVLQTAADQSNAMVPVTGVTSQAPGLPGGWEQCIVTPVPPARKRKKVKVDIGVLTILPEETRAVRDILTRSDNFVETETKTGRYFSFGSLPLPTAIDPNLVHWNSQPPLYTALTQSHDQGQQSIIAAYSAMIEECSPQFIVLLGIAGGLDSDLAIGDVVIADQIVHYDRRGEESSGVSRRGSSTRINPRLQAAINRYMTLSGSRLPTLDGGFNIEVGPVGSGEAVVKSTLSNVRTWLIEFNEKTLAVEMEAAGLATAARETGNDGGYLVIRGISDHADEAKSASDKNGSRIKASENAMRTLIAVAPQIFASVAGRKIG